MVLLIVLPASAVSLVLPPSLPTPRWSTVVPTTKDFAGVVLGSSTAVESLLVNDGNAREPSLCTHSLLTLVQFWQIGLPSSHFM